MAVRYWVGGNATWDATVGSKWASSSGGGGGQSVPTAADDVFLDNGTGHGNVTIGASAACRSLNCVGGTGGAYTGTLTLNASLSIGDATAGLSAVALKLSSGMTLSISSGTISLVSTSATQQTITSNGKAIGTTLNVNGAGGSWVLADDLQLGISLAVTSAAQLNLLAGTFTLGGKHLTCAGVATSGTTARKLDMASSTLTTVGGSGVAGVPWSITSTTNLTFVSTSSVLEYAQASGTLGFVGAGLTYGSFLGSGAFTSITWNGPNTWNGDVTFSSGVLVTLNANLTIKGALTLNGLTFRSDTAGTRRTVALSTTGSAVLTSVAFKDIGFTGTNTPVSGTSLTDNGNNSGITFATLFTKTSAITTATTISRVAMPAPAPLVSTAASLARQLAASITRSSASGSTVVDACNTGKLSSASSAAAILGARVAAAIRSVATAGTVSDARSLSTSRSVQAPAAATRLTSVALARSAASAAAATANRTLALLRAVASASAAGGSRALTVTDTASAPSVAEGDQLPAVSATVTVPAAAARSVSVSPTRSVTSAAGVVASRALALLRAVVANSAASDARAIAVTDTASTSTSVAEGGQSHGFSAGVTIGSLVTQSRSVAIRRTVVAHALAALGKLVDRTTSASSPVQGRSTRGVATSDSASASGQAGSSPTAGPSASASTVALAARTAVAALIRRVLGQGAASDTTTPHRNLHLIGATPARPGSDRRPTARSGDATRIGGGR